MAAERSIVPSPARLREGWRAGLRARSQWIRTGLCLLCLAALSSGARGGPSADLVELWREALVRGTLEGSVLEHTLLAATRTALLVCALITLAIVGGGLLTGQLGTRDPRILARLAPAKLRTPLLAFVGLMLLGLCVVGSELSRVVAGAARATDASAEGLGALFSTWVVHVLVVVGVTTLGLGLAELFVARRHRNRSLWRSVAQAREDAKGQGARP